MTDLPETAPDAQAKTKSPSPPPAYDDATFPQSSSSPGAEAFRPVQLSPPLFGPTPLNPNDANLPFAYYDARSPHALAMADVRAWRRFTGAALWVLFIFSLVSLVFGSMSAETWRLVFGRGLGSEMEIGGD